jgi:chaperone modulatory protein CbpM
MNKHSAKVEQITDIELLETDHLYSVTEVCTICQLDETVLQQYLEYGVVVTETSEASYFRQRDVDRLLRARRLQQDLELNHAGVALALDLLDTIESLKRDLALLRRRG